MIDLKHFKKIKEDSGSATLMHPQGHQIKIAKQSLSKKMQGELSSLPMHYEEGGDVQDENASHDPSVEPPKPTPTTVINIGQPSPAPSPQPMATMPAAGVPVDPQMFQPVPAAPQGIGQGEQASPTPNFPEPHPVGTPPMVSQPTNAAPISQTPATPQNDPYGANTYASVMKEGLQNQFAGIQEAAKAEQGINQAKAKAYDQGISQQQQALVDFNSRKSQINREYGKFMQDYQNQHIDPQHYLNSMGTGGKISTAIGLILGGMGGGLTHQGNPALDFLNKQISNDIEAQKANMDKGANLLKANMEHFKNEADATQMTGVMMRGILASRIESEGLKSSNPLIAARAKQAAGALESQNAQDLSKIAIRQSLQNQQNQQQPQGGAAKPQTPQQQDMQPAQKLRLMQMSGYITPEREAAGLKELGSAEQIRKARDVAFETFDKLNKINTVGNRVMHFGFTPASVDAIRNNAAVELARDEAGRVNEFEFNAAKDAFPAPGDTESTVMEKRRNLENIVRKKMNAPVLNSLGMDPFGSSSKPQVQEGAPVGLK